MVEVQLGRQLKAREKSFNRVGRLEEPVRVDTGK
jgi:hypothetical protein